MLLLLIDKRHNSASVGEWELPSKPSLDVRPPSESHRRAFHRPVAERGAQRAVNMASPVRVLRAGCWGLLFGALLALANDPANATLGGNCTYQVHQNLTLLP